MNASELEWRMYGLVPYNISPIQQGIQFGHAVVEYGNQFGETEAYKKWARHDKTFIILNGGTTNKKALSPTSEPIGTLNQHELKLLASFPEMPVSRFEEPDLGDQLTAICFLVDERVWDREKYPDFMYSTDAMTSHIERDMEYHEWKMAFADNALEANRIVFLRDFLKNFRLA